MKRNNSQSSGGYSAGPNGAKKGRNDENSPNFEDELMLMEDMIVYESIDDAGVETALESRWSRPKLDLNPTTDTLG